MTQTYETARASLVRAIENAAQCSTTEVTEARGTVCIATALVLIADELHTANEQNRGVGVWRDCLLNAINAIGARLGRGA